LAGRERASYKWATGRRQRSGAQGGPALAWTLVVVLAAPLSGCGVAMPLSEWLSPTPAAEAPPPEEITGSIPMPTPRASAIGDSEAIRRVVETAVPTAVTALAWTNPATGNSGTITELVATRGTDGSACRDFRATVATIAGVGLYAGRACRGHLGLWDLVRLDPTDAASAG
jgi:hypothetical protein